MRRRALLAGAAAGTTAVLAGCLGDVLGDRVQETRERTFDVPEGTPLRVATRNGDVTVEPHDGSAVAVTATVSAPGENGFEKVAVRGEAVDGRFEVNAERREQADRVSVDLHVDVPSSVPLSSVETENGDVTARDLEGPATFDTRNGDVDVAGVSGVSAARSDNGDVDVELPAPLPGDAIVATQNGDVDAATSPDVDATITASTENGDVTVDGFGFGGSDGDQSGDGQRRVSGTLGDGTHEVSVTTRNGDVEVRALE